MTLGIDLYQRYNTVLSWPQVKQDGVAYVYLKLSDGGAPASVHGDAYVSGAHSVGLAVGGYHYAQPTPSPEAQADVFAGELRRLGALDIAPALDLEESTIPAPGRAEFGRRFLTRLRAELGVPKVALYANSSWMPTLNPGTWNIPGLLTWLADYGPNDGAEHPAGWGGHVDLRQYTSAAHLAGIGGAVDADDITSDIRETDDLQPDERQALFALCAQMGIHPDGSIQGWQLPPKHPTDPLTLYDAVNIVMHTLTDPQPSRVDGSDVKLSPIDAAMNADAYGWRAVQQLAALTAAVAAQHDITTDQLTSIIDQAIAAHVQITGTVSVTSTPPASTPAASS